MRGMKGITEMMMEMVLVLMVLMKSSMEMPEGGWRSLPEVAPAAFPPSDLLRRQPFVFYFLVSCFSAASSRNSSGDYFYSWF